MVLWPLLKLGAAFVFVDNFRIGSLFVVVIGDSLYARHTEYPAK